MKRASLLLVCPGYSSFVNTDIQILSEQWKVIVNAFPWRRQYLVPWFFLRQIIFLFRHAWSCKAILISSGGYWALMPSFAGRLLGKPVYIILNGADCASIRSLNYGSLRKFMVRKVCWLSYRLATRLLPVSASLIRVKNLYNPVDGETDQGYEVFFPNLKTPATVMYNGLDGDYWFADPSEQKADNTFISVFAASQFYLKGGDLIVDLARRLPHCEFRIAGMQKPQFISDIPGNLGFLGYLEPEELRHYYRISRFHFQLSVFEGFGCSLCEAMLCECIPIVSSVNMLPEIIDDTGFVVSRRELKELLGCVEEALQTQNKEALGKNARRRVMGHYSISHRNAAFTELLQGGTS